MYIKSLNIEEFGMISDLHLDFGGGLNIVEGDNETGKTTISMFIKFIFYGLSTSEREKYVSWGKSGCRGDLTVVYCDKEYKIERTLTLLQKGAKDNVIITDDSLAPVFRDKTPAEAFLGVNEKVFLATSFVGQISGAFVESARLTEAVENLLFSADETTNTDKALKKIDELRVGLLYKNKKGGEIYELENKIAEYDMLFKKAQSVNAEIFETEEKIRLDRAKREENNRSADEIQKKCDEYEAYVAIAAKGRCIEQGEVVEAAKAKYESKKKSFSQNGNLPDEEYIKRLRELSAEAKSLKEQLNDAEKNFEEAEESLKLSSNAADTVDKINEYGGEHNLISKLTSINQAIKKKKSLFTLFLILSAVFVIAAIGCAVMKMLIPAAGLAGLFCVSAILCFVFASSKSKAKKDMDEYCVSFSKENSEELFEFLSSVRSDELMIAKKRADIESAGNICEQLRNKIDEKNEQVAEFTKQFSFVTVDGLDEETERCESIVSELKKLLSEAETQLKLYETLKEQTEKIDIDEEKKKIHGVLKTSEIAEFDKDEQKRRLELLRKSVQILDERILDTEKKLASITATAQNPSEIYEVLDAMKKKLEEDKFTYNALMLAYEKLEEGSRTLRSGFSPKLAREAGKYMQAITDGTYDSLGIDDRYTLSCRKEGQTHSMESFSSGTQDVAYISLRMALVTTLFRSSTPPLIFDDTFAHADDTRLTGVLAVLSALGRKEEKTQSILFTCHKREGKIASSLPETNIIRMTRQNG